MNNIFRTLCTPNSISYNGVNTINIFGKICAMLMGWDCETMHCIDRDGGDLATKVSSPICGPPLINNHCPLNAEGL